MKKIIIAALLCLGSLSHISAQGPEGSVTPFVSKRGIPYLPEAGDFALGVDASPFLRYLGNFFNQSGTNEAPAFGNEYGIYGKYFIEDNQAIRAKLYLEFSGKKYKQTVPNDYERLVNPGNTEATGIDTRNDFNNNVALSIGYELRRGKGRLQGFYGADLLLGYGSSKETYNYANPITPVNQAPSTYNFDQESLNHPTRRPLENKLPYSFTIGLGAFAGVEYFITPLISIGGEVNLGLLYNITGQRETTSEYFLGNAVQKTKKRERTFDSDNPDFKMGLYTKPAGSLFVMFYF